MMELTVPNNHAGLRLDRYLALALPQFSRSRLQQLIRAGEVHLQGKSARPRDAVHSGDVIKLIVPPLQEIDAKAEEIPLEILSEDDDLLVLNKPAGLVVHPGAGNQTHTLVNALLHHCTSLSGIGGKQRPGIVHRLDKETSGCLVVAKNDAAHQDLSRQFAEREVKKIYLALVSGRPKRPRGTIERPSAVIRCSVRKWLSIRREVASRRQIIEFSNQVRRGQLGGMRDPQWAYAPDSRSLAPPGTSSDWRFTLWEESRGAAADVACVEARFHSSADQRTPLL